MSDSETLYRVIVLEISPGSPFERTRAVPNPLDRQPFYLAIAIALKTGHAEQVFNRKGALPEAFLCLPPRLSPCRPHSLGGGLSSEITRMPLLLQTKEGGGGRKEPVISCHAGCAYPIAQACQASEACGNGMPRPPPPFFCGDRGTYALSATSHMHTLSPESQRHDNPYGRKETRSADGADSHVKFCQSRSECWSDGTKCPFCAAKVIRNLSLVQTFEFPPKTRVMKQATTVMSYRGTTTSGKMF